VLGDAGYATMISGIRGAPFEPATRVGGMKRAAGDMLAALEHLTSDAAYRIDGQRVAIMGYSAGGTVAVLAGAASDRFRGVMSSCAAAPLRRDISP
jgi:dipeptidyl aminopeptidase/acylaminoacyl peptidase